MPRGMRLCSCIGRRRAASRSVSEMSRPGSNGSAYQQGSDGYGGGAGAAHTWDKERAVIAKAEVTEKGKNPRFVLTSLKGDAQRLYEQGYCGRGEMENRIK